MGCKNILLITSDQQHYNTIGINNPEIETPNLDRLASQGMLFSRAYYPNPTCTPTRASLITGLYPSQHGAWTLGTKLPKCVPTIGDYLNKEGYETALIGKAHFQPINSTEEYPSLESEPLLQDLDFWKDFHGPFYGFNHIELARNHTNEFLVGQHYALWMEEKGCKNWRDYFTARPEQWILRKNITGISRKNITTTPGSRNAAVQCWISIKKTVNRSFYGRAFSIRIPTILLRPHGTPCIRAENLPFRLSCPASMKTAPASTS